MGQGRVVRLSEAFRPGAVGRRTWRDAPAGARLGVLLRAAGSRTVDGSDLSLADARVLFGIEERLDRIEAEEGAQRATAALLEVLQILEARSVTAGDAGSGASRSAAAG